MAEKRKFIQIGGAPLTTVTMLDAQIDYHYLPFAGEQLDDALEQAGAFPAEAVYNSSTIFLFAKQTLDAFPLEQVRLLPANQVFYEQLSTQDANKLKMLQLKRAQQVDLSDGGSQLMTTINNNILSEPWGSEMDNNKVQIAPTFTGQVTRKGSSHFVFNGYFGHDYQQLMIWNTGWQPIDWVSVNAEIGVTDGDINYFYRVYFENEDGLQIWDFNEQDLLDGHIARDVGQLKNPLTIALFAKGEGTLVVGEVHLRNGSYARPNFLSVGGRRLVDNHNLHEELGYYFDPADLKPPLNVYFSGWREKESYEGRWLMGSFGSPFILVYDPRIIGGSFFRGGTLEKQLVGVINEKLAQLGFTSDQLNLSGLSMGTYASFYYSTFLHPHGIVVGKPLASLGNLVMRQRLFTPYNWDLAMDTILNITGELTETSAKQFDQEFWARFLKTDYSKTVFIIAHMLQDTDLPFDRIFNHLKTNYPTAKVLHKGLEGRHNDDTNGIVDWFTKQYQALLTTDFGREFQTELELDDDDELFAERQEGQHE